MPSRSFSSPTQGEPVRFELDGEWFDCLPELPAGFGLDLVKVGPQQAVEFFDVVLTDESAERFAVLIRNREHPIGQATVDAIAQWLVEVYTGRPTGESSDSSSGPKANGVTSTPQPSQ